MEPRRDELDLSGLSIEALNDIVFKNAPDPPGLADPARDIAIWSTFSADQPIEDIGSGINEPPGVRLEFEPGEDYWSMFKKEFLLLICSNDQEHVEHRKEIFGKKSENAIATAIAGHIGAILGAKITTLIPLCAMALIALLKIGKDGLCAGDRWDVTLRPKHQAFPDPKTKPKKKQVITRGVKK
jgi:hypothetical protein